MINVKICTEAKKKLDRGAWEYLIGGAEDELAVRRNRIAFQKWHFIPRVLKNVSNVEVSTEFLKIPLRMPVIAAPIGGLTQFHEHGDLEWASGLNTAKIAGVVSGVAPIEFERIIRQTTSPLFYQLYFFGDDKWVKDQVQSAAASGYKAIVVTVDSACYGQRERDLLSGYNSHLAGWRTAPYPRQHNRCSSLDWKELEQIRKYTRIPLILKGIVSSEDVILAHDSGVEALWISNHGGRQLDQCSSTLDSLVELSSLLQEKSMPVIFDGGVRRGSHVLTALILGADLVAVGRLPVYGLIYSGADGVKTIFENIEKELKTTMKLVGLTNLRSARDQLKQLLEKENDFALATIWDKLED